MIRVIEGKEVIEIQSYMAAGLRVLFFLLALFPSLAPYGVNNPAKLAQLLERFLSVFGSYFGGSPGSQCISGVGGYSGSEL